MFRKKQYISLVVLLLLAVTQNARSQQITCRYSPAGVKIMLDHQARQNFVSIHLLLDKSRSDTSAGSAHLADRAFQSLNIRLSGLPAVSNFWPPGLWPEHLYNWTEQRYGVIKMTASDFNKYFPKILDAVDHPKIIRSSELLESNDLLADAQLRQMAYPTDGNSRYFENRKTIEHQPSDTILDSIWTSSLSLLIFGSFDIKKTLLLLEAGTITADIPDNIHKKSVSSGSPYQIDSVKGIVTVDIPLAAMSREQYVARLFIADYLKCSLAGRERIDQVKLYYPWNTGPGHFTLLLKGTVDKAHMESLLRKCSRQMVEHLDDRLARWYRSVFLVKMECLWLDPDNRNLIKLLSDRYLHSSDIIFEMPVQYGSFLSSVESEIREFCGQMQVIRP